LRVVPAASCRLASCEVGGSRILGREFGHLAPASSGVRRILTPVQSASHIQGHRYDRFPRRTSDTFLSRKCPQMGGGVLALNCTRRGVGALRVRAFGLADSFRAPCVHSTRGCDGADQSGGRHTTPDAELLLLVSRWRARAQEVLAQAETMRDADARQTMREIAARYERLAQQVSNRPAGQTRFRLHRDDQRP
jgi:hypothetical protein